MTDREEWLEETMDYMAHRYPHMSDLQLAQLEMIGSRFIKPAIPHGQDTTAVNRDEWQESELESELVEEEMLQPA
jgi:hypothetical protein